MYDKNIFLGTFPGRRYLKTKSGNTHAHIFHTRPEFKDHPEYGGKLHESLCLYYGYLYNEDEDETYLNLMEKDMLTYDNVLYMNIGKTLKEIYYKEKAHFNVDTKIEEQNENMFCHMSNESNKKFAEEIVHWLETSEFEFDINNYPVPDITTRGKYWPRS